MSASFARGLAPLIIAAALAGCASTGGLAPSASMRAASTLAATDSLANVKLTSDAWPSQEWWKALGDPQLDALIGEALTDSPTLRVAGARTGKALASASASKAALYPEVDAGLQVMRERFPEHGLTPPPYAGEQATFSQLQATLNWELDFWGKNRSAYDAALGEARAADIDAYAARLALSSNIALAYVQLQRAFMQMDVAKLTLRDREQVYSLTRDRNGAGIDSRLELKQSEAALPAARERIVELQESIDLLRNEIAALLGKGPDRGLAIKRPAAASLRDIALPSNIPAELLGRRPDLVALRERVEAAQKNIAVAKAEFYPNVNLIAFVGLQSLGPAGFLTAASRFAGVGPAVTLPIFDAGRLRANLAGRDADYDIAVEQYNQTLADAMRDVVDQLASFRSIDEQRREQQAALASAQEAYDLALMRYREGVGNYLQVLSVESPLLAQQALEADLQARRLAVSINLMRALGGGFTDAASPLALSH